MGGFEVFELDPRGFDDHVSSVGITSTDITTGPNHKVVGRQGQVQPIDFFFQ
jgi:hypothetical protein